MAEESEQHRRLAAIMHVLVTGSDNDYSVMQNGSGTEFDVYFKFSDGDPYATSIFCPLGSAVGCFFHDAGGNKTADAVLSADYSLLPGILRAYKTSISDIPSYVKPYFQH